MSLKTKTEENSKLYSVLRDSVSYLYAHKNIEQVESISSTMAYVSAVDIINKYNNNFADQNTYVSELPEAKEPENIYPVIKQIENELSGKDPEQTEKACLNSEYFKAFYTHLDTCLNAKDLLIKTEETTSEIQENLGTILLLNKNAVDNIKLDTDLDSETVFSFEGSLILVSFDGDNVEAEVMAKNELKSYIKDILKPDNIKEAEIFINEHKEKAYQKDHSDREDIEID